VRLADGPARPLPRGAALVWNVVRAARQTAVPEDIEGLRAGDPVEVYLR
jgi:hypothetical protein